MPDPVRPHERVTIRASPTRLLPRLSDPLFDKRGQVFRSGDMLMGDWGTALGAVA